MLTFRHVREDELDAFWDGLALTFGYDRDVDYEKHIYEIFDKDRLTGAFDGAELVGTFAAFSFDMTVPGASLSAAGTTIITVLPTHRRQGALTGMMDAHFDEVADRAEPIAALWASETPIYGRFGYGPAADGVEFEVDSDRVAFAEIDQNVTVRMVDLERAMVLFPPIFEVVRLCRPGAFARGEAWWRHRRFRDLKDQRNGSTAQRMAVAYRDGAPVGYIHFRTKEQWSNGHASGTVTIIELIGIDIGSEVALWEFISNMDLMTKIKAYERPIDDPLLWTLTDPRRLSRRISDSLWVRVLDVPAALSGRRYKADGSIVLQIDDPFRPASGGTFSLEVEDGIGSCRPTDQQPQLSLDARHLGAIYMGGRSISEMAAAGVITVDHKTATMADQLFRWTPGPWCPEVF